MPEIASFQNNLLANETIAYTVIRWYAEDITRRAIVDGDAVYVTEDGRKCPFGLFLKPEYQDADQECLSASIGRFTYHLGCDTYEEALVPRVQGLPHSFWRNLQHLHDESEFWSSDSSKKGKDAITEAGYQYISTTFGLTKKKLFFDIPETETIEQIRSEDWS